MIAVRQLERLYTIDDLADLPDDGRRYEVIGGELVVTASPPSKHQLVSARLTRIIGNFLSEHNLGEVFAAPYDVVLGVHDILEPDLLVLLNDQAEIFTDAHVVGPPALVIEILSPLSRSIDQIRKSATYAAHNVPEYWIVDPDLATIRAQTLIDGMYQPISNIDGRTHSVSVEGLIVDLQKVFAPIDWQPTRKN